MGWGRGKGSQIGFPEFTALWWSFRTKSQIENGTGNYIRCNYYCRFPSFPTFPGGFMFAFLLLFSTGLFALVLVIVLFAGNTQGQHLVSIKTFQFCGWKEHTRGWHKKANELVLKKYKTKNIKLVTSNNLTLRLGWIEKSNISMKSNQMEMIYIWKKRWQQFN